MNLCTEKLSPAMFCSKELYSQKACSTEVNDSSCFSGQTESLGLIAMGFKALGAFLVLPKSVANLQLECSF